MTALTVYDGNNTIGGNKIYIEERGNGIFLDFGMNFKKYGEYFQEFLSSRSLRGIYDLIHLNLIPRLKIYRKDLIPSDLDVSSFSALNVSAILLTHAHMDHFGNIGLLNPKYPVIASPSTLILLKGISDCSAARLGSDVAYFSLKKAMEDGRILGSNKGDDIGRDFICTEDFSDEFLDFMKTSVKKRKGLEQGNLSNLDAFSSKFEIKAYEVDHSIYGATAFIISGDSTIAYTGDFRLHGKRGNKSQIFIDQARDASILIIEGTRAAKEDINESEEIVYENCLKVAEEGKGLIIADFTARNFERMEIFHEIAKKVGRYLIITAKDAYLLNTLEKADGINRTKDLLVYSDLRIKPRYWEEHFLKKDMDLNYIDPSKIAKEPEQYLVCFSLYDIKHLLDIMPKGGTYIYSSSEAFEEETEFDFIRLNKWLKYFDFKIHGFEIIEEAGRFKPTFIKGFHASGHASKNELISVIDRISPDIIIPVHTDNPNWFKENIDNVVLLNDGEKYTP